ncbi:MAG: hypothetical protein ACYTEP_11560 [Planctomycetota bacterium]|jgi:hypothetical protein
MMNLLLTLAVGLASLFLVDSADANPQMGFPSGSTHASTDLTGSAGIIRPGGPQRQTLGPWELTAPDSAAQIVGPGSSFGWLNVVNNPVTLSEAMSSDPIESAGFANAAAGDTIEVTFLNGVTNRPGADLVMLDSQFDLGIYAISSDFDGFSSSVSVDTTFGIQVASTSYYYLSGGPYAAGVFGVEVDLSDIGVPAGGNVTSLRFSCTNTGCDPITLAKIDGGLELSVSSLVAGSLGTFDVTGGTPSGTIGVGYSIAGTGPTVINTAFCGPLTLDLSPPISALFVLTADAAGDLSITTTIPAGASGVTVHFQAVDVGSCSVSNGVSTTVL